MTVITNVGYQVAPEFKRDYNSGKTIIHVGVENSRFSEVQALLQLHQVSIYRTISRNLEVNGNIVNWVEIEGYVRHVDHMRKLCDELIAISFRDPSTYLPMKPLAVDILTVPVDVNLDIYHTNFTYPHGTVSIEYPYTFVGIKAPTTGTDLIRYISINTSKELPVHDNVLTMEQVQPRTAAVFYLSPYTTTAGLNVFVCGNTGEELVDELTSTEIVNDIVPVHVITQLLASTLTRQYDIARLLNAHKRLYGPISNEVFNTFVMYTYRYAPVLALLDTQPNPSDDEIDQAFMDVQP